jgi:glutamate racemase
LELKSNLSKNPIGVFDSGIGGLTVYRALREILPHEDFIYFGDTARLPYGTKSKETIEAYTLNAVRILRNHEIKFLVVACNTISSQALEALAHAFSDLLYCGVIAAGAEAAVRATLSGHIAVLATEGTVRSGIYPEVICGLKRDAKIQMLACNLLVALAEEGWCEGKEAEALVSRYLNMLEHGYDTLVLACTHFPLLLPVFRKLCPSSIKIVDSGAVTAQSVYAFLSARSLLNSQIKEGSEAFFVTDMPERFARLGRQFLGRKIELPQNPEK